MRFPLRMRYAASIILLACLAGHRAVAREEIPINTGWKFALRPAGTGFTAANFQDDGWQAVTLPHTWNALDGEDGGRNYVRGDGWYRCHFAADARWAGERVWVDFGAAGREAEVWLNGRRIGEHRGAYARFRFEVTAALRPGADNVLAVRVNNEPDGIVPLGGDFTQWGGLYRTVKLIVVAPAHIALGDHGSPGVYLSTPEIAADHATVQVKTRLENAADEAFAGEVRVLIRDQEGREVARRADAVKIEPDATATAESGLTVPTPHLWAGRSEPYLYRVTVELSSGGRVIDAIQQPLGIRQVTVDPMRGLFLNGRHVAAHGVNRHQDRVDQGPALSAADQREDFALIEELGATIVRLCHYQHDDLAYQLTDSDGLLVWAELAFVGPPPTTDEGRDNAAEQLRELIRQNFNHPSIFCWSIGNETSGNADPLLARLAALVKEEDPTRFSTYASHHPPEDPRNFRTDLLGYNRYYGWYSGSYDELGRWLDAWHARHPDRPLGLSEYGAGGSVYQHEQNPPIRAKTQSHGPWHPEEWQDEYHEQAWLTIKARPYLWGTFLWNMFDFASDGRNEGDTPGRNDKGLVTYDRRTRKDAFYWYKANWTDAPLVYITSRRDVVRLDAAANVKIYSNCDAVELWLNGKSQGARTSTDCRFIWSGLSLVPGPNRVFVVGMKGGARVTDSCSWTLATGTPYRPPADVQ